jgi:hypothetical protein
LHKVGSEWYVIDCVEEFAQILIEEGQGTRSDLEYFNFNYEINDAVEIKIWAL